MFLLLSDRISCGTNSRVGDELRRHDAHLTSVLLFYLYIFLCSSTCSRDTEPNSHSRRFFITHPLEVTEGGLGPEIHRKSCMSFQGSTGGGCGLSADTLHNNDVVITSKRRHFDVITSKWRRFDIITTASLCHVFGGVECLGRPWWRQEIDILSTFWPYVKGILRPPLHSLHNGTVM